MMFAVCLGCLLLLLYYLYQKTYSYWSSRGVPFDKPFLIFGSFFDVAARKKHIFHVIREIYDKFDTPYVGIYILNQPTLMVRSPELLKKILVKDFDKFVNRKVALNESVDPIAANALFSAKDQIWRGLRAKITPVFTSGKMKLMVPLMKECAEDLNAYLDQRAGETLEFRNVTKMYAVDIISSCAFGVNSYCLKDENSEIMKVATRLLDLKSFVRNFSVFSFFFMPKFVDIFRLTLLDKVASDHLTKIFKSTIAERQNKNIVRNDLIDQLNNLKHNEKFTDEYKFDDIKMAAQALSFFSAGNDTTSLTISFTLYELALNPTIQDRLRQEVQETFAKHGDFTYDAIYEMKYLDMVVNETLRKYPLTTFLNRNTAKKYTFEETGFTLDEDVSILIPVAGLHFDPEYFPDPEKYDPERFSEENKNKIPPYTFLPFGDGPRNCIGQRFGLLVTKMALAYTLKDFAFERTAATAVPLGFDPASLFLQNKTGLHMKVVKV
jgi:cytochrome P450 family 6